MGGCVSSVMEQRNVRSLKEHPKIAGYLRYGPENMPVIGSESAGYSPVYRIVGMEDDAEYTRLLKTYANSPNWVQLVERYAREYRDRPALAYREIARVENKTVTQGDGQTKVMQHYHCGPVHRLSYHEMWEKMTSLSRGLATLGLQQGDIVSLYEETRWEWLVSAYAIWLQDMIVSTVYANLGEDALAYALKETESKAIICNGKSVASLMRELRKDKLYPILIYLDQLPADLDSHDFQLMSWTSVVQAGNTPEARVKYGVTIPTENEATALIMYTSGTTGNPKGVMHSHGSIAAGCRALDHCITDIFRPSEEGDVYVSYLPLAHILEFALVNINLSRRTLIGFGSPRTLTDVNASPHGDLTEYKPTFIIGVPRIFDTIKKAVESKLPPPGSFKRQIFDKAYESRLEAITQGKDTPYWNEKVFSSVRQLLGGNMAGYLSGGGPLSASTQEFMNVVCGGAIALQGWGLTETVCCGAVQRLGDLSPDNVGQLVRGVEFRLRDTDTYKHTDKPEPRGEICLRGPFMFKGYFKQPELTAEVLDSEGWFRTGDVGSITQHNKVRIIGRIKGLAKNAMGEYIALETLEAIYANHPIVLNNCVCVMVNPYKHYIGALAITDKNKAMHFASQHGINTDCGYPALLNEDNFRECVVNSLAEMAQKAKRKRFEFIKTIILLDDEWTPENGMMTAALKLRRNEIAARYAKQVDELFKE